MRKIDAHALERKFRALEKQFGVGACGDGIALCIDALQEEPTLVTEKEKMELERPETEWLWLGIQPDGTRWWCKNCGRHVKDITEFCPYCGADARKIKDSWTKVDNIRRMTEENLQDTIVCGYFIRDLIVTAERLRKEGVDPHKLRMSCDDFLEGYKTAREEIYRHVEKSVQDVLGNIRELPIEEKPKTDGGEEDERQNQTGD